FNSNAGAFSIQTNGQVLTLVGAGIINNSGIAQVINNQFALETAGATIFQGTSSAGNLVINNLGDGTSTQFQGNSSAGNATITNSGAGSFTLFGVTTDEGSQPPGGTAANATITNTGA